MEEHFYIRLKSNGAYVTNKFEFSKDITQAQVFKGRAKFWDDDGDIEVVYVPENKLWEVLNL